MIHKTVLAFVLSLSLALVPALAQAQEGGDGGGDPGGDVFAVQKRVAAVLTVIHVAQVFNRAAQAMVLLNLGVLLQGQQNRLIQGGPDVLSNMNRLFAINQAAFVATVVLMLAMLRGARWQRTAFIAPKAARGYSMGVAMMAFTIVALMLLPYTMMNSYGKHGLASMR